MPPGRIPNEGETDLKFKNKAGHAQAWVFQVAGVDKVAAAVSSLVGASNYVVFDCSEKSREDVSFITNKATGHSVRMRRERNVWVPDAYIEEDTNGMDAQPDLVVARHKSAAARVR